MEHSDFWARLQEILDSPKGLSIQNQLNEIGFEKLWFKIKKSGDEEAEFIWHQLKARDKYNNKFPELSKDGSSWVFPVGLPLEQSSSEATANYKSTLARGQKLYDLTGGMGIDALYIGKNFQEIHYFDLNPELCALAHYNLNSSGLKAKTYCEDSEAFIQKIPLTKEQDWIYLDPARRVEGKKVFLLTETQPDPIKIVNQALERGYQVMLKTSPMLDISLALQQLPKVSELHIIGLKNEVKELLFVFREQVQPFKIKCVELAHSQPILMEFDSFANHEVLPLVDWSDYLYEPHPTLIKADMATSLCAQFHLQAVHPDIKLYTSATLMADFPGKVFKTIEISKVGSIKKPKVGFHIMAKNYPETAEQVRKKYKIPMSNGCDYMILTRDSKSKPIWIRAERLS